MKREVEFVCRDLNQGAPVQNASVVILNLTLQFVRPLYRQNVIRQIADGLHKDGCLLLIEKVLSGDSNINRFFIKYYYDFKQRNGYSQMEISQKREALENVLIPYQVEEDVRAAEEERLPERGHLLQVVQLLRLPGAQIDGACRIAFLVACRQLLLQGPQRPLPGRVPGAARLRQARGALRVPCRQRLPPRLRRVLALAGEFVRCLTIGYDYIERGGRDGKVYASFLVKGGVYAHTRNPMYVGNCLIAVGLILYSGAPLAILVLIPFFLFVYESITSAEEAYLLGKFGDDYRAYCRRVSRYLPPPGALYRELSALTYDGKKALRKEYGTLWVVGMGLTGLPWWRMYHLQGAAAAIDAAPLFLGLFALLFVGLRRSVRVEEDEAPRLTPAISLLEDSQAHSRR